jgi:hypothetical protein
MSDSSLQQFNSPGISRISSFEDEITADVETIISGTLSLYATDMFKQHGHGIDIYYPRIDYPLGRQLLHNSDSVRFQLSLYPDFSDLALVDKIVLKPRHIESGGVELMALYICSQKTLIHYLYTPHSFPFEGSISSAYNEFTPYEKSRLINRSFNRAESGSDAEVSPLLYILSLLPSGSKDDIDKFFVRHDYADPALLNRLDDISHFYSRYGY